MRFGCYGIGFTGLPRPEGTGVGQAGWPTWRLRVEADPTAGDSAEHIGAASARVGLSGGGRALLQRHAPAATSGTVALRPLAPAGPAHVAHPLLAPAAVVISHWLGRLSLHGGGIVVDDRVWLICAPKGGGKSSALALASLEGHAVTADDLSVVDAHLDVWPGPGFIDLRRSTARHLGIGVDLGIIGVRRRWRHHLDPLSEPRPLAGVVLPTWGPRQLTRLGGSERLQTLAAHVALRHPDARGEVLLQVAGAVPVLRWSRPRDLARAAGDMRHLLQSLASEG